MTLLGMLTTVSLFLLLINPVDSGGHIKDPLGQLDPLAGALVDDLIEQL